MPLLIAASTDGDVAHTLLTEKLNSAAMSLVLTPSSNRFLTEFRISCEIGAGMATIIFVLEML